MKNRLKGWNRLEQMEQIRPRLIWNRWNRLEQTKRFGLFHPNRGFDLRKCQSGTAGTDETAFSNNLIKSIYKVIKGYLYDKNRKEKNVYRIFARLFRSICSTNKCSCFEVTA